MSADSWIAVALSLAILVYLIYTLLRLEDNSLLVGAIASFLAVAAAMYFTRRIDWYNSPAEKAAAKPTSTTEWRDGWSEG